MSNVFVTQETPHNFNKAEVYGEIVFLTRDDLNNVRGSLHNQALVRSIKHQLRNFDEHEDWLVITGSPYVAATVFMILGLMGIREVNVLRWDNRDYDYVPLHIDLRRMNDE